MGLLVRLRLRSRTLFTPLRSLTGPLWTEDVWLCVLDRPPERGDIERRGDDRGFEGVRDWAADDTCCRERERPRSGVKDGMVVNLEGLS